MAAAIAGIFNHALAAGQTLTGTSATPMASPATAAADTSSTSSSDSATISANDFLTLLVTEMQNQDPTADTDPNEYINQLVHVNSLEQLIDINQNLSTALGGSSTSSRQFRLHPGRWGNVRSDRRESRRHNRANRRGRAKSRCAGRGPIRSIRRWHGQQPISPVIRGQARSRQSQRSRCQALRRIVWLMPSTGGPTRSRSPVACPEPNELCLPAGRKGLRQPNADTKRRFTMASFYIPLSGLNADSTALNTIANDLSNMNTTAFKGQTTNFSDLFYQQVGATGSGEAIQVGGGVQVASNNANFTQGSFDTSGTTSSDVALDGNGFFVLNDGGTNVLTRDGAFTQNTSGNLVTSDGLSVMGYPASNGVVNTNAPLAAINIPVIGQVQQPQATTTFGMTANLDSAAPVGTSVPGQVQVFDSMGNSYQATVAYTKTGTNEWSYSVSLPDNLTAAPAAAPSAAVLAVPSAAAAGTTTLDNTLAAATAVTGVTPVTQSSSAAVGATTLSYNLSTTAGTLGTIDQNTTSLTITGPGGAGTVTVPPAGANETAAQYASDITTAMGVANMTVGAGGVTVLGNAITGQLSFAGTTGAFTVTGNMNQDLAGGTTSNFAFNTGGTVDPFDKSDDYRADRCRCLGDHRCADSHCRGNDNRIRQCAHQPLVCQGHRQCDGHTQCRYRPVIHCRRQHLDREQSNTMVEKVP